MNRIYDALLAKSMFLIKSTTV